MGPVLVPSHPERSEGISTRAWPLRCAQVTPNPSEDCALHTLDLAVVGLYFAFTLGVGLWVSRHQRSAADYFLGARDLPAWAILLSIVATETSALTVISVPGIGARGDLTFLQLTFGYLIGRIAVARWLLPGYFRGEQETAYARLESRFGVGTRRLTSLIFLVSRFLGDAVRVFASAIPLALVTGWSVPTAIVVMGIVTMVYTWFGGFKAVVWTDVLQLSVYLGRRRGRAAHRLASGRRAPTWRWQRARGRQAPAPRPAAQPDPHLHAAGRDRGRRAALGSVARRRPPHRAAAARHPLAARRTGRAGGLGRDGDPPVHALPARGIGDLGGGPGARRTPSDQLFPAFIVDHLPVGPGRPGHRRHPRRRHGHPQLRDQLARLLRHARSVCLLDRTPDPLHLLRVGRLISAGWALGLIAGALFFHATAGGGQTPVVVLALSIASVTYGPLLGTYFLAGRWPRARGRDVVGAVALTVAVMLVVVFAKRTRRRVRSRVARAARPAGVALVRPARHPPRGRQRHGAQLSSGPGSDILQSSERTVTRILIGADVGGSKTAVGVSDGDTVHCARGGQRGRGPARAGAGLGGA